MRKGQIESIDLFIAMTVYLLLIAAVVYTWNLYTVRFNESLEYEKMQLIAFQITDLLVKSPGYKTGWEKSSDPGTTVEVIGLAQDDRVLSEDKVTAFTNINYDDVKQKFNIEPYDYKFKLKDLANNTLLQDESGNNFESGKDFEGDISIVLERYVLFNNEKTIMEFTLWK